MIPEIDIWRVANLMLKGYGRSSPAAPRPRSASTTRANSMSSPSPVVLTNPAAILLDLGIAQLTSDRLQFGERPLLVRSLRKNMNVIYDAD